MLSHCSMDTIDDEFLDDGTLIEIYFYSISNNVSISNFEAEIVDSKSNNIKLVSSDFSRGLNNAPSNVFYYSKHLLGGLTKISFYIILNNNDTIITYDTNFISDNSKYGFDIFRIYCDSAFNEKDSVVESFDKYVLKKEFPIILDERDSLSHKDTLYLWFKSSI